MFLLRNALALVLLVFSVSSVAAGKYHFKSQGEEISVFHTGSYYHPTSLAFKFNCPQYYCDYTEKSKRVIKDFIRAVQNDQIYSWVVRLDCPPTGPCNHPDSGLDDNSPASGGASRQKKAETNYADTAMTAAASQAGSSAVDRIFDWMFGPVLPAGMPTFFVIQENGVPTGMCEFTGNVCEVIPEITFTVYTNGDMSAQMTVNPASSDRFLAVSRHAEDFLRKLGALWIECRWIGTGPSGDLKWRFMCYTHN